MEKYWFKNRRYGVGWRPATWQGWILTGLVICMLLGIALYGEANQYSDLEIIAAVSALVFLFLIVIWRTGEPLRWQWGATKKDKDE